MYSECEQTLGEASATNNVCAGGYRKARLSGKAPGSENIPAEIYREDGQVLLSKFGCLDGFITMVP